MAFFDSQKSKMFMADSTAALQDISAYCTEINGLPGKRDVVDVTTFGATGHKYGPSLENAEFTLSVLYSEDASTGIDTIFGVMRTSTTTRAFQFSAGATTGKYYSGSCWLDDYAIRTRVGQYVEAQIHCKVDGGVTRT